MPNPFFYGTLSPSPNSSDGGGRYPASVSRIVNQRQSTVVGEPRSSKAPLFN